MDNVVPPPPEFDDSWPLPPPLPPAAELPAPPPTPSLEPISASPSPTSSEHRKPSMDGCPYAKRRKMTAFFEDDDLDEDEDEDDRQTAEMVDENSAQGFSERREELNDQLRQFQVLDEVQGDNSEDENEDGQFDDDGMDNSSEGSGVDIEELDNLLEENLPEGMKSSGPKAKAYEERFKEVLEEKGRNHFEVLPEGWVQATHVSGMPLFLHTASRVCTASRPYFLGPGSVRKHEIPLSAIPCLNYRKALEKEDELRKEIEANAAAAEEAQNNAQSNDKENQDSAEKQMHNPMLSKMIASTTTLAEAQANAKMLPLKVTARIETVNENLKAQSLRADVFQEYCKKLFKFKTIRVMRFKSWAARRKLTKHRKHMKNLQRPTLPDGTKLITFPVLHTEAEKGTTHVRPKKEWIMNPNGKSYVCILHEYVQHALRKQPSYEFKELENAATPYSATVSINELKYGTGYGTSKKQAKSEAARETLEILIPDMKDKITSKDNKKDQNGAAEQQPEARNLSVFDEIKIEDPRVAEFCAKTTEPSPHTILQTCLQRNFGLGDVQIQYDVKAGKHRKNEFTMTVGKHTATVVCKNKRDGKQRASQAILQVSDLKCNVIAARFKVAFKLLI
ncbi:hypothetical protein RP20_CCG013537 [Aedes albopictus]|nr:hypothetical protein RP20_CCG013537 [Aedes albopictus]